MKCSECGVELEVGDWPYCVSPGGHGRFRERDARAFEPIVVWASDTERDKYSFPGEAEEPTPPGYHKLEITNLREADRFVSRVNAIERAKSEETRALNYQALDERIKARRENIAARIRGNPRAEALFRQVREWADRRRDEKRAKHSRDPRFNINVLSFDSSNRNPYSGPKTGWRDLKK